MGSPGDSGSAGGVQWALWLRRKLTAPAPLLSPLEIIPAGRWAADSPARVCLFPMLPFISFPSPKSSAKRTLKVSPLENLCDWGKMNNDWCSNLHLSRWLLTEWWFCFLINLAQDSFFYSFPAHRVDFPDEAQVPWDVFCYYSSLQTSPPPQQLLSHCRRNQWSNHLVHGLSYLLMSQSLPEMKLQSSSHFTEEGFQGSRMSPGWAGGMLVLGQAM